MSLQEELGEQFGRIDIYLFDQIMRGRLSLATKVLDAGCGAGRNSHYLLRRGVEVHGVDADSDQIDRARALAHRLVPGLPDDRFRIASLTALPYSDRSFGGVICSAVLHFAEGEAHFEDMVTELWRVLAKDGVLFARLASTIGIEELVEPKGNRRFDLPDGSERFLVDEALLLKTTERLGGQLLDPLKTTNVQNLRAMTTWVLRKGERP